MPTPITFDWIRDVQESVEPVTLVLVGPLTNVAMAVLRAPRSRSRSAGSS